MICFILPHNNQPWRRVIYLLLCLFICYHPIATAQNATNYGSSSQFASATNASLADMSSGTTLLLGANMVNTTSTITSIGFETWFMGQRFTQFSVNTNGVLKFGASPLLSYGNIHTIDLDDYRVSPISSKTKSPASETVPITGNFATSNTGKVHCKLFGSVPNRYLVIEWKDLLMNHRSNSNDKATFQLHIYETTPLTGSSTEGGRIYFVYGEMPTDFRDASDNATSADVQLGIGVGVNTGDYLSLKLDGVSDPTPTTIDNDGEFNSSAYVTNVNNGNNIPLLHSSVANNRRFINLEVDETSGVVTNPQINCLTPTQLTLTWDEPSTTNAVATVIYRSSTSSSSGFVFAGQTTLGSKTFTDTGLTPSQTYYYRLYLVNEGKLGQLGGSASISVTTLGATTKYAIASGDWSDASIWSPAGIPTGSNNVVIQCTHQVKIGGDVLCQNLSITTGGSLSFYAGGHTLAVSNHLNNAGTLSLQAENSKIEIGGNLNNSGSWQTGASSTVTLRGTSAQTISNTGSSIISEASTIALANGGGNIPDGALNLTNCTEPVSTFTGSNSVSRFGNLGTGYNTLTKITLDITHSYNEDVELWIQPPGSSTAYQLSTNNGGSGTNYTNVTFSDDATQAIDVLLGAQSYNNITLRPECQTLSSIPVSSSGGTVYIYANDDYGAETGTFNSASVTFEKRSTVAQFSFCNLVIDNSSTAGVTLNNDIKITSALTLTDGVINAGNNEVIFIDNATVSNGSNASYIDGLVRKIGDDAFVFPVGNDGFIASLGISAPASLSDEFTTRYYHSTPTGASYDITQKDVANLASVNACEYWLLNRTNGSSGVTVSISYENTRSCINGSVADLRVAHWKAGNARWESEGNGGSVSVGGLNGIVSNATVNNFSPFTLGSVDPLGFALPSFLLDFSLKKDPLGVLSRWTTLYNTDVVNYQLQRSLDGANYTSIGQIASKKSQAKVQYYSFRDYESSTMSNHHLYYRLQINYLSGAQDFSKVKHLAPVAPQARLVKLSPNPCQTYSTVHYEMPTAQLISAELLDLQGNIVYVKQCWAKAGVNQLTLHQLDKLAQGIYVLQLTYNNGKLSHKLMR